MSISFCVIRRRYLPCLPLNWMYSSHDADIRKQRDGEKDRVLAAAGLPLIRYRAKSSYSPTELASLIGRNYRLHGLEPRLARR